MKRGPYKTKPTPGSVLELVRLYRQSPRYQAWAATTRAERERFLHAFETRNGKAQADSLRRGDVIRMRDSMALTPAKARNWLATLRALYDYALDIEMVAVNPFRGVSGLKMREGGHATWGEHDIDRYLAHWRPGSVARRAAILMLCTGAARVDAVALGWQNVSPDGCRISYRRQKMEGRGGPLIDLPILPDLAAELATIPRTQMTFLETVHGRPRSHKSLTEDMRRWTAAAGLPRGLTSHGLRKSLARRLAEHGATVVEIMAVLGHKSPAMAMHYVAAYDRAKAGSSGMERLGDISGSNVTTLRRKPQRKP